MNIDPTRPRGAVAYTRTATEEPLRSTKAQVAAIKAFCLRHGITLMGIESDSNVSGLTRTRKGLERILTDWAENPEVTYIITRDRNRISRRAVDFLHVEKEVMEHDKEIIYLEDEKDW